jgi:RND family efflux transporter MFP subunit
MTGALSACRNGLGGLLALAALAACQGEAGETPDTAPVPAAAIAVEALSIAADGAGSGVRASGLVAYKREAALGFGAPGQIETLSVDAGDRVAAGQVIATLRKISVGADEAESALARQTAQQNFDRVTRLFEAGASSQAELDSARLALERTRERISIIAPSGGVVLARQAEPGQTVSAGQPVVTIGENRAGLVVRASMTPAEVGQVKVGDTASVLIEKRAPVSGTVLRIAPRGSMSGTFEVEVGVSGVEGLRAGEVAEISLAAREAVAGAAPGYFVIPAIALIDARADQGVVFVIDAEGKARRRPVETGGVTDAGVSILKGLVAGDRLITRGASMVRDGDAVRVGGE